MPQLLVRETAVHFIDTFRYLLGEVGGRHGTAAPAEPGHRRRGRRASSSSSSATRAAACSTATASTTTWPTTRAARWARCGSKASAACCAWTARRACGSSRTRAPRPSTAYGGTAPGAFGGACTALQAHVLAHLRRAPPLENSRADYLANLHVQAAIYALAYHRHARA